MAFTKIAEVELVQPGTMKKITLAQQDILLANVEGTFYALNNKCPHMGGDLSMGKLDGTTVSCPRHGAAFDLKTGKNLVGAKVAFISMKVSDANAYPVKVEGTDVFVDLA